MDDSVKSFLEQHHGAVQATIKPDGQPHMVRIGVGLVDGKLWSSGTQDRVRTGYLRRDPRSTLFVFGAGPQDWLGLETTVAILEGADAPELNLRLYQQLRGDPDNIEEYLEAMVDEQRLIYEFEIVRSYGQF
ncbi:MAG: pyridoxamine 5'-phosphate oxidase family protein [Actinomycetota bacterium]